MPDFPPPDTRHPFVFPDGSVLDRTVFLSAAIDHPNWDVGDFSYASTFDDPPKDWAARLAPHLYPGAPERLILGRFCQIAHGTTFITSSANHRMDGHSTYPFAIFSGMEPDRPSLPAAETKRDTVIGHDVWIGQGAMILPGARIGSGVIIGAGSVVGGEVPPFAVVAGNRAKVLRMRFDDATIAQLLEIAWWNWEIDRIMAAEAAICGSDLAALKRA